VAAVRGTYSEEHPDESIDKELSAEEIENLILYEVVDKHIALVTLNRPERLNAMLAPYSNDELGRKIARAEDDDDIKVIVLTGAGRGFCGGIDLRRTPVEAAGMRPGERLAQSRRMHAVGGSGRRADLLMSDKTVICAVKGPCVAAGMSMAIAADIIIAGESGVFGEPEARIGFAGFSPSLPVLALKVGVNRARSMLLTGRMVTAAEFHEWGAVESVVPDDQLMDEAMRYAKAVAWHSTDNLMLGRRGMHLFWQLMGTPQFQTFFSIGHPLFTNVVWREDEWNFFKERNNRGLKNSLIEMSRQWEEMGF
jgi:enoyl-CoA hydratase